MSSWGEYHDDSDDSDDDDDEYNETLSVFKAKMKKQLSYRRKARKKGPVDDKGVSLRMGKRKRKDPAYMNVQSYDDSDDDGGGCEDDDDDNDDDYEPTLSDLPLKFSKKKHSTSKFMKGKRKNDDYVDDNELIPSGLSRKVGLNNCSTSKRAANHGHVVNRTDAIDDSQKLLLSGKRKTEVPVSWQTFVDDQEPILSAGWVEKASECHSSLENTAKYLNSQDNLTQKAMTTAKKSSEQTLPFFLDTVPRCKRSKRKGRILPRQRWKIDNFTFDEQLEKLWATLSDDKKSLFAQVDSICFSLYRSNKIKGIDMIRRKDIFSKEYVIVPIVCWDHWRLVIFCHFGNAVQSKTKNPCILLLDSVETNARLIEPDVRKFVFDIFDAENREGKGVICEIPVVVPKVPQQENDVDCGRFVLYFIKEFVDAAPENLSISNGYPYFMRPDWFDSEKFNDFCDKLDKEAPPRLSNVSIQKRTSQRIRKTRSSSRQEYEVVVID